LHTASGMPARLAWVAPPAERARQGATSVKVCNNVLT